MTEDEYALCERLIASLVRRMAGNVAPFQREDLRAEAWRIAMEAARKWDGQRSPFAPYMWSKIRNGLVDYFRRNASRYEPHPRMLQVVWIDRAVTEEEASNDQYATVPSILEDPPVDVNRFLDQLNPRYREVIELYYLEGLNLREIGERYGLTAARICQLKGEALDLLRRMADA